MRILVTGVTGFVGSHMVDYILTQEPEAYIFASRRWRSRDENITHMYGNDRIKFIEADLLDRGSLAAFITQSKPDAVFHFAAQSFPETSFIYPVHTLNTNVIGTTNLLDELRLARDRGVCDPVIVSVSSSEVYGMPKADEIPITEINPIRAANPYSISKVGHDLMSQHYYSAYKLKVIITRMFSHEGARRGKKFALSSFAHQIVSHEKQHAADHEYHDKFAPYHIKVGNLDSIRTYAHIDDAVRAYWVAFKMCKLGEVYNIGGVHTCTVREALDNLISKSVLPRDHFKIVVDPDRIRPTDITLQIPDVSKFSAVTGWKPIKTIDDITQDLLDYWRGSI